jgi:mannose-6-phosphate isomerase-like protein (cupin superfamily)
MTIRAAIIGPSTSDTVSSAGTAASAQTVRLGPATIRILEDGATTGHRIGIVEITLAPRSEGPPQHRHAQHDEGFYVVSGTGRFTIGTDSHDAPPGTLAMIPPGAPHTFANPGDSPLVLVNTFTPDLYVQYFRDLQALATHGAMPSPEETAEVMRRYATEVADTYAATQHN